jgi:hypothetical protein
VGEFYDGTYTKIDVDLNPLAGQTVKLILNVTALSTDPDNTALWVSPGIYRKPLPTATSTLPPAPSATITATPTQTAAPSPTATPTPLPAEQPPTLWESIRQFFDDLLRQIFGG